MFGFLKRDKQHARLRATAVGCFGKLPAQADFVRMNGGQREAVAFDRWVQEGVRLASRLKVGREVGSEGPVHCCVMTGTQDDRSVIATLMPSRDHSGRRYPFVLFKLIPRPGQGYRSAAVPVLEEHFLAETHAMCCRHGEDLSMELLEDRLTSLRKERAGSELDTRAPVEEHLLAGATDKGLRQAVGDTGDERWYALLRKLDMKVRSVALRGAHRIPWGVRLPLPFEEESMTQALVFWLRSINGVLGAERWRPAYFWSRSRGNQPGRLTLFFRAAPPAALLECLEPGTPSDLVVDLTAGDALWLDAGTPAGSSRDLLELSNAFIEGREFR